MPLIYRQNVSYNDLNGACPTCVLVLLREICSHASIDLTTTVVPGDDDPLTLHDFVAEICNLELPNMKECIGQCLALLPDSEIQALPFALTAA